MVPWRPDDDGRSADWTWTRERWKAVHPEFEVVVAQPPDGSFNAARAVNNGARRASGHIVVVAWADIYVPSAWLLAAVDRVRYGECLVATAQGVCKLDRFTSAEVRSLPPTQPPVVDPLGPAVEERRYSFAEIAVTTRAQLASIPFDEQFDGWGHEGHAWLMATEKLTGGVDRRGWSYHLWHRSRPGTTWDTPGAEDRRSLYHRYMKAAGAANPDWMKVLVQNTQVDRPPADR